MTNGTPQSTIDGVRILMLQIDQTIESLLEAHGFAFKTIKISDRDVLALFGCAEPQGMPAWELTVKHSADDEISVSLIKGTEERPQLSLSILIGKDLAQTLAEAVGLAVSFVAFSDQMRNAV